MGLHKGSPRQKYPLVTSFQLKYFFGNFHDFERKTDSIEQNKPHWYFSESFPRGEEKLKPENKSSCLSECPGLPSLSRTGLLKLELRLTSSYLYGLVTSEVAPGELTGKTTLAASRGRSVLAFYYQTFMWQMEVLCRQPLSTGLVSIQHHDQIKLRFRSK